ncbi:MAG: hypothetical protein GXP53_13465 [Deltaproteobacteria bacterium]|nr:hypothetical protein [Deltaproteobacteria bacterium]
MLLSYHPCYAGDKNRLCAGRDPDESDRRAMTEADGVVLPQGCRQSLFEMAAATCANVFPDYHARFKYPGKTGQSRLFKKLGVHYPRTEEFSNLAAFYRRAQEHPIIPETFGYPFVFKFDWSGEGINVLLIKSQDDFNQVLQLAETYEGTGQKGFVIQKYIPAGSRSLRVVAAGSRFISYWRVAPDGIFGTALADGAVIDHKSDPSLQEKGINSIRQICAMTGINLAGFDLIFDETDEKEVPCFLEINYFFGRRGLGGSEMFYELLCSEIDRWRKNLGL